jgi:hypothetical protein
MASMEKISNLFMASQTTSLYYFNLGFFIEKFLLTCETIRSKSPFTCRLLMFILIVRLMPRIMYSYSAMSFVQSNSILYEKRVVSFSGDLKTIPAPEHVLECASSKSMPQDPSLFSSSIKREFPKISVMSIPSSRT